MNTKLSDQLKRHEGFRKKPYECSAGKLTIGIGRNIEDVGITREEAEYLLANDIEAVTDSLSQYSWFNNLDSVRQDVLINMGFQLGIKGLMKFKKMIAALKIQDFNKAVYEMSDSGWRYQTPGRAKELMAQMRLGSYIV